MESLKNMKYMFEDMFESARGVISKITITLENVKLPNVEDMSYMFTRDFTQGSIRR
ncbi:hypothetical protein IKN40_00825 [bacterium]|nr:hypothetical protein [bacterium]